MVRIDLSPLEISENEVIKKLRYYFKKGYRWKAYFDSNEPDFQIWTPKYSIDSQQVIDYFHNLEKLEIGNKEQEEKRECLDLIRLLLTAYYQSEKGNLADKCFLDSNIMECF